MIKKMDPDQILTQQLPNDIEMTGFMLFQYQV